MSGLMHSVKSNTHFYLDVQDRLEQCNAVVHASVRHVVRVRDVEPVHHAITELHFFRTHDQSRALGPDSIENDWFQLWFQIQLRCEIL